MSKHSHFPKSRISGLKIVHLVLVVLSLLFGSYIYRYKVIGITVYGQVSDVRKRLDCMGFCLKGGRSPKDAAETLVEC